jgi:glucosamine--fructose-6-phosphate aminotransferase (isomerizing)
MTVIDNELTNIQLNLQKVTSPDNRMPASYLNDLLDQPRALQATIDSLNQLPPVPSFFNRLKSGKYRRVILTGMGSSYHGLYPLQLHLFNLPVGVIRLETAELIHYADGLINPANLIVAVSQSGESAEVVQLADLTQGRVDLIGVTNTPGSALAEQASLAILTCAGEEATVSCKTFISALAALTWLGDQLTGEYTEFETLADSAQKVADYWAGWPGSVELLRQRLTGIEHLFLLGRGSSMTAACAGALIIKEAARFAAEGMNCAAFRHGPLEVVSENTLVIVYRGAPATAGLNIKLAQDILDCGGLVDQVLMGEGSPPFNLPECSVAALPILEIQFAQMVSLALAELQDFEAGKFVHASKVTTRE